MSLEITPKELQNLILQGNTPVLVDVREFDLGGDGGDGSREPKQRGGGVVDVDASGPDAAIKAPRDTDSELAV